MKERSEISRNGERRRVIKNHPDEGEGEKT